MQPLKKIPLLIHSNLELYILHAYIRLCGTVQLLEFDQKRTKKKEPMKKTYEPQRKKKVTKKESFKKRKKKEKKKRRKKEVK